MARLDISPAVLAWARERAAVPYDDLVKRFKAYPSWENGEGGPTFAQLETLASLLHLPIGMFFLAEPPVEELPLPDFRRVAEAEGSRPSTDLIDTIHTCQTRQAWYREYVVGLGEEPLDFIGSATIESDVAATAGNIRTVLGLEIGRRADAANWTEFLRNFAKLCQDAGILVMINGIVGNNTRRKLNPQEFRGFAISDNLAPLVFVNGADTKAAQIFTLAHEIAHLWLGKSGISHTQAKTLNHESQTERWCNAVAAEILVPLAALQESSIPESSVAAMESIARSFRVSTLVALRRLADLGRLTPNEFDQAYQEELERVLRIDRRSSPGGDFYNTMNVRVDRRFASAVLSSALEGKTLMGDAMRLLSINKTETLRREARELGLSF